MRTVEEIALMPVVGERVERWVNGKLLTRKILRVENSIEGMMVIYETRHGGEKHVSLKQWTEWCLKASLPQ